MGIIYYSNYICWFEEVWVVLLVYLGFFYKKIEEFGIIIFVLEVNCSYKEMIYYGEKVSIYLII